MTLLLALLAGVPAPARAATPCELGPGSPATLPEIKPGFLKGYLEQEAMADALALLEGPPPAGSAAAALDQAQANASFALRDSARWTLAARDADLHFPAAAISFSCALGVPINATDTPRLLLLMRRSMTDLGLSTDPAKNRYQRQRPFMVNNQPICTPADEKAFSAC